MEAVLTTKFREIRAIISKITQLTERPDDPDQLSAKVALGIKNWRPEFAVGQLRMEGCQATVGLTDMTLAGAKAAGAKTLVIGVANRGGYISPAWKDVLIDALGMGFDIASGLHNL